jgi:Type II CAAX prenyl endopeptidase Rce1-like
MSVADKKNFSDLTSNGTLASPAPDLRSFPAVREISKPCNLLPDRYIIKSNGDERVLICLESPNLNIHMEVGLSVSGSMARKSPGGTIFLDGAAQCEPFMDHERQVYNLDHHEGCVRPFTLATCEQTLVMYMKGLDLQGREWNVYANEPDLDTLLAIWILLNHARIGNQDVTQRRILFALVRYEGVIDALGLELKELSALPPELVRKLQRVIDHLRSDELGLKKEGRWGQTDLLTYSASILHKIDQIFYKPSDFADFKGIEELARVELTDQRIATVVEADMGIYEIEPHLNKLYGNRLGVVFLKKGLQSYTVRQMDLFMPFTLEDIYERLNFMDPAVKCRTQTNKWGGAADIGGSPRETGTRLSPSEIAQCCRDAAKRLGFGQQLHRFGTTTAMVVLMALTAYAARLYWNPTRWFSGTHLNPLWSLPNTGFVLALLLVTGCNLLVISYCRPWQFGWIRPTGNSWWLILPVALVSGLTGGVWAPKGPIISQGWTYALVLWGIGMPLAAELLFRSLAHGLLTQGARIQRNDSRWFLSWPLAGSALLYTVFITIMTVVTQKGLLQPPYWGLGQVLLAAALFGIATGMVRERSQSLFPAILFHIATAVGTIVFIRLI